MDLDTRQKRASALGLALATLVVLPAPDATLDQADRQQMSFAYSGILAEELNIVVSEPFATVVVRAQARTIVVRAEARTVIVA